MPTIASVSVKYGRKYQARKDDWVSFEALITLTVSAEEADTTDPHEVAAEAFAIARQAVRDQAADLRRQLVEAAQRAAERRAAPPPATFQPAEPPLLAAPQPAHTNSHRPQAPVKSEPPFLRSGRAPAQPTAESDPPFSAL